MGQPRSRYQLRSLIIENSRGVSHPRRLAEFTFASFLWFLWSILWLPVINAIVWFFGYRLVYYAFPKENNFKLELVIFLIAIVILVGLLNFSIFQALRKDKKQRQPYISFKINENTPVERFFSIPSNDEEEMKQATLLRFKFQEGDERPNFVITKSKDGNVKIQKLK